MSVKEILKLRVRYNLLKIVLDTAVLIFLALGGFTTVIISVYIFSSIVNK